jgi:pimeloyl-ACP methyl ester carboxylesterase
MNLISFHEQGQGDPVLLIHGFPFHRAIWDDYIGLLSDRFLVITVDLPGFGNSPILPGAFTLADVGDALLAFIAEKKIDRMGLIGHSLGGYVALSMVEKNPSLFSGLVLFHSTAYADSPEKKDSRAKVVEFVKNNGAEAFTTKFIPPLFVDQQHPAIPKVTRVAAAASDEAVTGYTLAMRDRPDQIKTLERFKNPTLFLAGKNDPGIPVESIIKQAAFCQNPHIRVLENVAHMGMFELPEQTAAQIKDFLAET